MRYFVLDNKIGSDAETEYEPNGDVVHGEAARCPKCGNFVGMLAWLPPFAVRLTTFGSVLGDVAFNGATDLLVSERCMTAWRNTGLQGIDRWDSVEVVSVTGSAAPKGVPRYFHLYVPRSAAKIDERRSRLLVEDQGETDLCSLCGGARIINGIDGLFVDERTWHGEDIFVPWGLSGVTLVTERDVEMARKHGLRNVTVTPAENYWWDPLRLLGD